ncbi:unnamed protein product, partial [Prorocentrum cordatum]
QRLGARRPAAMWPPGTAAAEGPGGGPARGAGWAEAHEPSAEAAAGRQPLEAAPPMDSQVTLPAIDVCYVEDACLPDEVLGEYGSSTLPSSVPFSKVAESIVKNAPDFESVSEKARMWWLRTFKSERSMAVIGDTYWFCICSYFKADRHKDVEQRLYARVSENFVGLFRSISHQRKDFFFRGYADAVAQAVFYSMFILYPKSRASFKSALRRELVTQISYWTTGVRLELVDTSHWRLSLGSGDVLQPAPPQAPLQKSAGSTASPTRRRPVFDAVTGRRCGWEPEPPPGQPRPPPSPRSPEEAPGTERTLSLEQHRRAQPCTPRHSPLLEHFFRTLAERAPDAARPSSARASATAERANTADAKCVGARESARQPRGGHDQPAAGDEGAPHGARWEKGRRSQRVRLGRGLVATRHKEAPRADAAEPSSRLAQLHRLQLAGGQGA